MWWLVKKWWKKCAQLKLFIIYVEVKLCLWNKTFYELLIKNIQNTDNIWLKYVNILIYMIDKAKTSTIPAL